MPALLASRLAVVILSGLVFAASFASATAPHLPVVGTRHGRIQRSRIVYNDTDEGLTKRGGGARFTHYITGLGACGGYNSAADFVVALNAPLYGGGGHCRETVTITANGKTTQAQIVDECMGCGPNDLDFSDGLFQFFAPLSDGEIFGEWHFGNPPPPPPPPPPPKPTPPPPPPKTSTKQHSSTPPPPPPPKTTSTSSSSSTSATSTISSAAATPTPDPNAIDLSNSVLNMLNLVVIQLGGVISEASQVTLQTTEPA